MDRLPLEIVTEILNHLPSTSYANARLASRTFNSILSKRIFTVLASFVDPHVAQRTLTITARDPSRRTRAIWSPHCLVPKGLPITESFLLALWVAVHGESWAPSPNPAGVQRLTVRALQSRLPGVRLTQDALRQLMFRYALYLSYVCRDEEAAPQAWVFDYLLRRDVEVPPNKALGVEAVIDNDKQAAVVSYWGRSSLIEVKD